MLTMYRFMCRQNADGELEPIVRFRSIAFPDGGPAEANAEQLAELAKAVADAASQEARYGQIVLTSSSATGAIVAVENLATRGQPDSLVWLI
jgi:hypothetical protein